MLSWRRVWAGAAYGRPLLFQEPRSSCWWSVPWPRVCPSVRAALWVLSGTPICVFVLTKANLCRSHVRCHRAPESEWPRCAHGAIFLSVQVVNEGAVAGGHVGWRWPAPKGSCTCLLGVTGGFWAPGRDWCTQGWAALSRFWRVAEISKMLGRYLQKKKHRKHSVEHENLEQRLVGMMGHGVRSY